MSLTGLIGLQLKTTAVGKFGRTYITLKLCRAPLACILLGISHGVCLDCCKFIHVHIHKSCVAQRTRQEDARPSTNTDPMDTLEHLGHLYVHGETSAAISTSLFLSNARCISALPTAPVLHIAVLDISHEHQFRVMIGAI
jgi:hypothetical protein